MNILIKEHVERYARAILDESDDREVAHSDLRRCLDTYVVSPFIAGCNRQGYLSIVDMTLDKEDVHLIPSETGPLCLIRIPVIHPELSEDDLFAAIERADDGFNTNPRMMFPFKCRNISEKGQKDTVTTDVLFVLRSEEYFNINDGDSPFHADHWTITSPEEAKYTVTELPKVDGPSGQVDAGDVTSPLADKPEEPVKEPAKAPEVPAPAPVADVGAPATVTVTPVAKADPLDHDGDGRKGGSLPKTKTKSVRRKP